MSTQHCKEKRELIELVLQSSRGDAQNGTPQSVPHSESSHQQRQSYRSSASSGHYNVNTASTSNDQTRTSQNADNEESKPARSSRVSTGFMHVSVFMFRIRFFKCIIHDEEMQTTFHVLINICYFF